MGVFAEVRGFVEGDDRQMAEIRRIVDAIGPDFPYRGGWVFPQPYNWSSYAFYGASIRASALEDVLEQLRTVARIPASDEDGDRVTGWFLVSHETDGPAEWQVRDGDVHVGPARRDLDYLDGYAAG
ncbi:hypothetical protein [Streptomyces sp. NPDC056600]|uniref:hypothetical protein n=1 Tax=Streptomyces sp. NPDC056600 TaxID=3345874 RepID=UPI0036906875